MTEHSVVYHDPGFWAATPANNGGNGPTWQTHIAATVFSPPHR